MSEQPMLGFAYGIYEVLYQHGPNAGVHTKYMCRCIKCGTELTVRSDNIVRRPENCQHKKPNRIALGSALYSRLYLVARNATARCTDSANAQWDDYGARGIATHLPWVTDIQEFIAYLATLPNCTDSTLVLDRINNDGNYEPSNLQFVTYSESNNNRRTQHSEERYYKNNGFGRVFSKLRKRGLTATQIGELYCISARLVNCVDPTDRYCGENHGMAKLTQEQVLEAKACRAVFPGYWTWARLGERYNVSGSAIRLAVIGRNWQHLNT